jgi:hypothetical protein
LNPDDVLPHEMERPIGHDHGPDPLDGGHGAAGTGDFTLFAEDLCSAFPETPVPERMAEDHVAAMIGAIQLLADKGESALEPTSNAHEPAERASGLPKLRRRTMRKRMITRVAAVATAMLLSLGGLAFAGVLPGPWDNQDTNTPSGFESDPPASVDDEADEADEADDQGEDGDDQGEDGEEAEEAEEADDQGEEADDQGEDGDDQGEDGDDQGEDESDGDEDQGDDESTGDESAADQDQGDDGEGSDQ